MRELENEGKYRDRLKFTIVPNDDSEAFQDAVKRYGFGDLRHGLVCLSPTGEVKATIPGHDFGRAEIEAAIGKLLP